VESTPDYSDGNSCSSRAQIHMRMAGFRLEQVTVTRGLATLLGQVSVSIPAGRCTAVTGASGAGKSTLLRLLNRLDEPTSGHITLDGVPIAELEVLALRRRVGLVARALAVEPKMLLLDEPTSALDGASAEVIGALIGDYVSAGGTVVLVSHDHGLIESVAAQVLVLDCGRLVSSRAGAGVSAVSIS